MISCDFDFCIFNKDEKCILNDISISTVGACQSCMLPDMDDEDLLKLKAKTLKGLFRLRQLAKIVDI